MDETKIDTSGGAAIGGNVDTAGGAVIGRDDQKQFNQRTGQRQCDQRQDNRQHDQRTNQRNYEQRDDSRGGNVTFQNADNAVLWQELRMVNEKISEVRFLLDDIPNRVRILEVKIDPLPVTVPIPVVYPPTWLIIILVIIIAVIGAFFLGRVY